MNITKGREVTAEKDGKVSVDFDEVSQSIHPSNAVDIMLSQRFYRQEHISKI